MDATADVILKAKNAGSAESTSAWTGQLGKSMVDVESRQDIKESLVQQSNQSCQISSVNQMNDITIYAQNSSIEGGIEIDQTGNVEGSCVLDASFSEAASALGESDNTGMAGKKANKKLGGADKKGAKMTQLTYIVALIVIGVVVYSIAKMMTGGSEKKEKAKQQALEVEAARKMGCPGGLDPIKDDKTGEVIVDMRTMRPKCPVWVPPSLTGEEPGKNGNGKPGNGNGKPGNGNGKPGNGNGKPGNGKAPNGAPGASTAGKEVVPPPAPPKPSITKTKK
uniref:Lipid membrane protein n=1 Tax=Marseillevirus LCMAC101 TaxID=2506602 RepID=A0A481YQT3_9VIRU|nr:MAG: lipid membrane protein [Marseillevirus LCMAC101]